MNDIDTARIKRLFYEKIEVQKKARKPVKYKVVLIAAALLCLMSITAFAAQQGAFGAIIRNFGDVSDYLQESGLYVSSNGITMQLANYLADDRGIVMELIFTRDDGGVFPFTSVTREGMVFTNTPTPVHVRGMPENWPNWLGVRLHDFYGFSNAINHISADGRTLHSFAMLENWGNLPDGNIPLGIYVDRLVYNEEFQFKSIEIDFFEIYQNSEVIILDNLEDMHTGLFDLKFELEPTYTHEPIVTDFGATISNIFFVSARVEGAEEDLEYEYVEESEYFRVIDFSLLASGWNYFVGFRYIPHVVRYNTEYHFFHTGLTNNDVFFATGRANVNGYFYRIYRVRSFEDLQNLDGIDFVFESRDFITGEWYIETEFTTNREAATIETNLTFYTENPDVFLVLRHVEISLLSTTVAYDIVDAQGRRITDTQLINEHLWGAQIPHNAQLKLLYDNGETLDVTNFLKRGAGVGEDGLFLLVYNAHFTNESFTLMNTTRLQAVVIVGEVFEIN